MRRILEQAATVAISVTLSLLLVNWLWIGRGW